MNRSPNSGVAPLVVVAVLAIAGLGVAAFKPKWLHGDTRRAETSASTTEALLASQKKLSSTAAASVTMIGEANTAAPDSPVKNYIAREVPVALSLLEAPDPVALLAAAERKNAVLQGKVEAIERLYGDQARTSEALRRDYTVAIAAKRASDTELAQVAAERLGAEKTATRWMIVAGVCVGLYLWVKLTHIGPGAMAEAVADMRKQGATEGITALDGVTSRIQQKMVRFINKLTTHAPPEKLAPDV